MFCFKCNKFQFPSNGKVSPKHDKFRKKCRFSLGFNSLQTGKCLQRGQTRSSRKWRTTSFNSLQTGKCIQSTGQSVFCGEKRWVSIPFKRESVSKEENRTTTSSAMYVERFNSLQTGKCIQSRGFVKFIGAVKAFQFPSNGKVSPKSAMVADVWDSIQYVSIPFKRESVSKGIDLGQKLASKNSFNSLQTGKCLQSL